MDTYTFEIPNGPGSPAITPTIDIDDARVPAYTIADARAYVEAGWKPSSRRSSLTVVGAPTVASVRFTTSHELGAVSADREESDPDRLLCVAEVAGRFEIIHGVIGVGNSTCIFDKVTTVYDARTGNLLTWKWRLVEEVKWPRPEGFVDAPLGHQ